MPTERPSRTSALLCVGAAAWLLVGPATALAQTTLQWTLPAGSPPVSEFRVYKGPALDAGEIVWVGLPTPNAGIYAADVQIDEIDLGVPVYVWLTAANQYGESPPSNENFYPEGCDPGIDTDCDGVPNVGSPGGIPCATGQTQGCDDNCPYWSNPGQEDIGGVGPGSAPDGIGNACQCGDVTGNGRVTTADLSRIQYFLGTGLALPHPELCDVAGSSGCTSADLARLLYALGNAATLRQECEPALAP